MTALPGCYMLSKLSVTLVIVSIYASFTCATHIVTLCAVYTAGLCMSVYRYVCNYKDTFKAQETLSSKDLTPV